MRLSLLLLFAVGAAAAQPVPVLTDTTAPRYGSGAAAAVHLTEYGFGVGGLYRARLSADYSFLVEARLGAGKDEREQAFFVGLFGETVVPFKRNYVLLLPLHVGVERRLFREAIEDNFRPYVQATAGPTFAYQWPYFRDEDGSGTREEGEERLSPWAGLGDGEGRVGVGGTLAVGAWLGRGRQSAQGVRFGFSGSYFFREVELLEEDPEVEDPSRRFFGTPVVSFHFLRLR